MSKRILYSSAFIVATLVLTACASSDKMDTATAEGAYALGLKYEKDKRYEEAISYFAEVKNKHPYSSQATDAELKIADIEFARENFAEAETAYKLFREFRPTHPKTDYVILRLGQSLYKQLPSTIDRDLAVAYNSLEYFNELLSQYPDSSYAKEARDTRAKVQQMLADKEMYIAEYYFKRSVWPSALGRFESVMRSHPNKGHDVRALYGATISAYKLKELDKAKAYFKKLLADHPKSSELAAARKELSDGF